MEIVLNEFSQLGDFASRSRFVRDRERIDGVKRLLDCDETLARVFFSLLILHAESDEMLNLDDPLDSVLYRIATGVRTRAGVGDEGLRDAVVRAKRVFDSWKRRDKAAVVNFLEEECVRHREDAGGNETRFQQIRGIAGPEAEERARQRCARNWTRVHLRDLENTVNEIAEQAYWDAMRARVSEDGDVEGTLFPLIHSLQRAILALLSAAPRRAQNVREQFDVDFLVQMHRANALTRRDVGRYVEYVSNLIASMQAPADDHDVRPWAQRVRARAGMDTPLREYLGEVVVVVREASQHLGRIVQRLQAYRDQVAGE